MIWKALADPTRRNILDLLHKAPLTTGEVYEQVEKDLSRYAVMKHLGILEKANLITTRREGKFRWNHLNTSPIKESYDQWLHQLLQLKRYAAPSTKSMGQTDQSIRTTTLSFEVPLAAPRTRVWKALIQDIGQWWPKKYLINPKSKKFILEATPGGLWIEDNGAKGGQVWGMVIGIEKSAELLIKGHLSPGLGGPAISFIHFILEAQGKKTRLRFTDTIFGEISSQLNSSLQKDWEYILGECLAQHLAPAPPSKKT